MCLDVDYGSALYLSSGTRKARKDHRCHECRRTIDAGETYSFWAYIDYENDNRPKTSKMCSHCKATIDLGCALTGCPEVWYWGEVHNLDPEEGGFVGDILANHDLAPADKAAMLRTVAGRRARWQRKDGTLMPVPSVPVRSKQEAG